MNASVLEVFLCDFVSRINFLAVFVLGKIIGDHIKETRSSTIQVDIRDPQGPTYGMLQYKFVYPLHSIIQSRPM